MWAELGRQVNIASPNPMPQDLCAAERVIFEHRICLGEMILSLVRDVTNNGGKSDGNAGREWAFTRDTFFRG